VQRLSRRPNEAQDSGRPQPLRILAGFSVGATATLVLFAAGALGLRRFYPPHTP